MWLPNFVLRWIGKDIAEKLNLKEGSMDTKKWYQSTTIWTAIVGALIGIYGAIGTIHPLPPIPEWIYTILGSMGLVGLRTADKKIAN